MFTLRKIASSRPALLPRTGHFVILVSMKDRQQQWQKSGSGSVPLHHAYGLAGPREEVLADVLRFVEMALKLPFRGNPDVFVWQCDTLTVDDSRRIKEIQSRKALGDHKAIIAVFNTATREAQNSLLKVLEEPVERTHLFLILPRLDLLLPTVRSRLFTAAYGGRASSEAVEQAVVFAQSTIGTRLAIAKKMADDVSDGNIDKNFVLEVLNHIEQELWKKHKQAKETKIFDEVALCRNYLSDNSASIKMLLEHLAVALPPAGR